MKKLFKSAIMLFLTLSLFMVGCNSVTNGAPNTDSLDQFVNDMKSKGYSFSLKDVDKCILDASRKRMLLDKEIIDIFLYNSNKEMEEDSKGILDGGSTYKKGNKGAKISWPSPPYYYKKGTIIVQYIGENEKIISDLNSIFGGPFVHFVIPKS